jgi:hypothetical protein
MEALKQRIGACMAARRHDEATPDIVTAKMCQESGRMTRLGSCRRVPTIYLKLCYVLQFST